MPKNGMPRSRAKRMASTLPSMPRSPKPPGTRMPSKPESSRSGPSRFDLFALNRLDADLSAVGDAGVVERLRRSTFVGVAVLDVFADEGDGDLVVGVAEAVQHARASRRGAARSR